jgi:hypothetical protein
VVAYDADVRPNDLLMTRSTSSFTGRSILAISETLYPKPPTRRRDIGGAAVGSTVKFGEAAGGENGSDGPNRLRPPRRPRTKAAVPRRISARKHNWTMNKYMRNSRRRLGIVGASTVPVVRRPPLEYTEFIPVAPFIGDDRCAFRPTTLPKLCSHSDDSLLLMLLFFI